MAVTILAFDDTVEGNTAVYSDPSLDEKLGESNMFMLIYATSQVADPPVTTTLTIYAQTTPNGIDYGDITGAAMVNGVTISATARTFGGSNGYFNNMACRTRIKVQLGGTNARARVQVWLVGRDFARW